MNTDIAEGKWKKVKGRVKQEWGELTNDDLDYIEGSRERLVGKLQERYGYEKEEAERALESWERTTRV